MTKGEDQIISVHGEYVIHPSDWSSPQGWKQNSATFHQPFRSQQRHNPNSLRQIWHQFIQVRGQKERKKVRIWFIAPVWDNAIMAQEGFSGLKGQRQEEQVSITCSRALSRLCCLTQLVEQPGHFIVSNRAGLICSISTL